MLSGIKIIVNVAY